MQNMIQCHHRAEYTHEEICGDTAVLAVSMCNVRVKRSVKSLMLICSTLLITLQCILECKTSKTKQMNRKIFGMLSLFGFYFKNKKQGKSNTLIIKSYHDFMKDSFE